MSFRIPRLAFAVVLVVLVGASGCARPTPKSAMTPSPSPGKTAAASAVDATPNRLRDRRAEPGVRRAAKALVVGNAKSVKCGGLSKGSGEAESLDLLGGRLRVRPPAHAKVPAPIADAPPIEEESRIVVEGTKLSLAIVARETFQLDPDLYEVEADAAGKPGSLDIEAPKFLKATFPSEEPLEVSPVEIGETSKMRGYAARPAHPNAPPGKDTALVLALLVAQEDGALESVGFYVRGKMVRNATGSDLVGCTRLAERIASTLTPGPRKLEREAGTRHVADVSKDETLALTVPADYVVVPAAAGAGARVTKLRPLSLYAGSISVALTDSGQKKLPEGADAVGIAGTLLGRPMEWHGKATPKGGFVFASEPLEPNGASGANGTSKNAEVLVKATREAKALEEMRLIAETLAVVKR